MYHALIVPTSLRPRHSLGRIVKTSKPLKKNARRWAGGQVEKTYQPPANSVFYCARVKAKRVDGKTFQEKRPENFSHQALT